MLSPEQQLAEIISAQVKGGYSGFDGMPINFIGPNGDLKVDDEHWHILEILLDPYGLRAAYGKGPAMENATVTTTSDDGRVLIQMNEWADYSKPMYEWAAHKTLDSWIKSYGDPTSTIQTAFSLLPTSH